MRASSNFICKRYTSYQVISSDCSPRVTLSVKSRTRLLSAISPSIKSKNRLMKSLWLRYCLKWLSSKSCSSLNRHSSELRSMMAQVCFMICCQVIFASILACQEWPPSLRLRTASSSKDVDWHWKESSILLRCSDIRRIPMCSWLLQLMLFLEKNMCLSSSREISLHSLKVTSPY